MICETLNCARLFKNQYQVAVNGLTILMLIPSRKLTERVPQVILNTITIDPSKMPSICARALSHALSGKRLLNYAKLIPRMVPLVECDQTGSVLRVLAEGVGTDVVIADQLRKSGLPQRLIALVCFKDGVSESGKSLQFDEVSTAATGLLHVLMDENIANIIKNTPSLRLINTVVDKLMNTQKIKPHQNGLKLIRRYIECSTPGLPSDILITVLEFLSLENHDPRVIADVTELLKLVLSNDDQLMRAIHVSFIRPHFQGIQIITPLLTSNAYDIKVFGCSILKKVSQLQFSCCKCGVQFRTSGSRYYTASTQSSYCRDCHKDGHGGGLIPTEGDFRWMIASHLMGPASLLFEEEMQRITSPDMTLRNVQESNILLDLMSVFTVVFPTNCVALGELSGRIISVASTILSIMPAESEYISSLLVMLSSFDDPVITAEIGTLVDKIGSRIQDLSDTSVATATAIMKRSIAHAGDRICQSLCSILPLAYSNNYAICENVASCIRQALSSSSFKEKEIESVISEHGLTASLYQLLEAQGCKSQAKADCIYSIHKTIRKDPQVGFLMNERSLKVLLSAFSYFQNINDEICSDTADIMRFLVNCPETSSSTIVATPRDSPTISAQEALKKKARVLLTDEGFQMMWMFASSVEQVQNDAMHILIGLLPVLVDVINESSRCEAITPYLMGILVELSKDATRYNVASIFKVLAADSSTCPYFNQLAVTALFDISMSSTEPHRCDALQALRMLHDNRVLVVRDSPDTVKTIRFRLGNHNATKKLTFTTQPTISKLRASIQEVYKGENIQIDKPKLRMGATVLTEDSDLCLMSGIINVDIDESAAPSTPHRKPNWLHTFARPLGKGAFGQVYLVVSADGHQYAAKCMTSTRKNGEQIHRNNQESFENEISLLSFLEHDNIVRYYGTAKKDGVGYIIMEYVPGGSLLDFKKLAGSITEEMAGNFIVHALKGIEYLHDNNVIHLDVKSANLLIGIDGVVKVADFGCGVIFDGLNAKGPANGTILFMAPEVLTRRTFSFASDIWSLGCTLIEMLFGLIWNPKLEDSGELQLMHHLRSEFANNVTPLSVVGEGQVSKSCRQFLEKCLQINPDNRFTAKQLLNGDPISFTGTGGNPNSTTTAPDAIQQHLQSVRETNQAFDTSSEAFTFATASGTHISAPPSMMTVFNRQGPPTALQGPPTAVQGPPTAYHVDTASSRLSSSPKSSVTRPSVKGAKRGTLPKFSTTSPKLRTPTGSEKSKEWSNGTTSKWLQGNPAKHKE
eukprot:TRINITY_DN3880_c0_g1_i1.p1 TRINITY_DN3880_c0_g1~~TRINITY_DN3880_c0_g1_i1.p1  ORF type:complete len:1319 (+),score=226.26 TRINITY_DN3880_c0_g1_i1:170-3958(+)